MSSKLSDLAFVSGIQKLCDMGGRGVGVEMKGKEVAGIVGTSMEIGGRSRAQKTEGNGNAAGDTHGERCRVSCVESVGEFEPSWEGLALVDYSRV